MWLLHRQSPTRVRTYAYVNPLEAAVIGHFLAGEPLTRYTVLGTRLELASAVVMAAAKTRKATAGSRSKA